MKCFKCNKELYGLFCYIEQSTVDETLKVTLTICQDCKIKYTEELGNEVTDILQSFIKLYGC